MTNLVTVNTDVISSATSPATVSGNLTANAFISDGAKLTDIIISGSQISGTVATAVSAYVLGSETYNDTIAGEKDIYVTK